MLTVMFTIIATLCVGWIFHALGWGLSVSSSALKHYGYVFGVVLLIIAVLGDNNVLADAVRILYGCLAGMHILRWAKIGQLTDTK